MMPTITFGMVQRLEALAPILVAVAAAAIKGAALIAFAAVAGATLMRHQPAAARHALWAGVLGAHLVLLLSGSFLPAIPLDGVRMPEWLGVTATEETRDAATASQAPVATIAAAAAAADAAARAALGQAIPSPINTSAGVVYSTSPYASLPIAQDANAPRRPGRDSLVALWLIGVALVLGRLILGTVRVRTLARAADRLSDPAWLSLAQTIATRLGIARPLTLLRGDRLAIPVTWGVVFPAVLLPAESDEWSDERRRVVLVHEMAHVKRFDALTQILAQLVVAIFWFDPLVWLAARRLRTEREQACDDYVIRDGTRPSHYADALLDMVRRLGHAPHRAADAAAFAALAMARPSDLERRMRAILDPIADRHVLSRAGAFLASVIAMLLVLPLAALRPAGATTIPISVAIVPSTAERLPALMASLDSAPSIPRIDERMQGLLASLDSALATVRPVLFRCTREDVRSRNTTFSMHSDTDKAGRSVVEYYVKRYGRCVHVTLGGPVTFTADERDVASLGPNGRVQLHERTLDWERALVVTRGDDGRLQRAFTIDGRPAAYDAAAREWVGRLIEDLARESGIAVPARVARVRGRGGVPAVLTEIEAIESSSAKRKHYEALLEGGLGATEMDDVVRHAGRELAGSSSDLRAVLGRVPPSATRSVALALEGAIAHMGDDDKRQALTAMLDNADPPTMLALLRLAEQIGSDGEKASFLRRAAARAIGGADAGAREAFFKTYATIGSDGEKREVLIAVLRQGQASPALTREVIRGSTRIGSDGEKASVLLAVARGRLLVTEDLRDEYIKAARSIGSDGEYRQVIDAVLGGRSS